MYLTRGRWSHAEQACDNNYAVEEATEEQGAMVDVGGRVQEAAAHIILYGGIAVRCF